LKLTPTSIPSEICEDNTELCHDELGKDNCNIFVRKIRNLLYTLQRIFQHGDRLKLIEILSKNTDILFSVLQHTEQLAVLLEDF
jgi:hypothetical protein